MSQRVQYAKISLLSSVEPGHWLHVTEAFERVFARDSLDNETLQTTLTPSEYERLCRGLKKQVMGRIRINDRQSQQPVWLCYERLDTESILLLSLEGSADVAIDHVEELSDQDILRRVLDLLPSPVFIKDQDHRLILTNSRFDELLGLEGSVIGKSDYDFFPPEEAKHFWDMDEQVMSSGEESIVEESVSALDGEMKWMLTHKIPTQLTNGETGLVGIITDITERKRAEHEVILNAKRRDEAILANQAKSRFMANISHELRTPLNAIIGYTELMTEEQLPDDFAFMYKDMGRVISAAHTLLELIDEVLDLSTIEAGKMKMNPSLVDLTPLLVEVHDLVKPMIGDKAIELNIHTPTTPIHMVTDRKRFKQVLMNLCSNAIKFTQQGEVSIKAHLHEDMVTVCVQDTGVGIAEDRLADVFVPFERDEKDVSTISGTGLGLPLARYLSQLMGGDVRATSQEDVGSIFTVHLPVRMPETVMPMETNTAKITRERMTLLLVGSDHSFCDKLRRYSDPLNVDIMWADTIKQGLNLIRLQQPQAIIFDASTTEQISALPLEELKEKHVAGVAIILTTPNPKLLESYTSLPFLMLNKPISKSKWAQVIESL